MYRFPFKVHYLQALPLYKAIRHDSKIIDFEWVYANHKVEALVGNVPLKGKRYNQTFNSVVTEGLFKKFIKVVENNQSINEEVYYTNEQEHINSWLYVKAEKLSDGLIVYSSDITERKRTEQELEKAYKDLEQTKITLEQMLNGSLAGIAILESLRDEEGKIKDFVVRGVNRTAELLYQRSKRGNNWLLFTGHVSRHKGYALSYICRSSRDRKACTNTRELSI